MRPLCLALFAWCLLAAPPPAWAGTIPPVPTGIAGFVGLASEGSFDEPTLVTSYEGFVEKFGSSTDGLPNPYLAPSAAAFFANGGEQLYIVRVTGADDASLVGIDGGFPGSRTGLQALRDVDEISVVAIPGAVSGPVQTAIVTLCEEMGERIAVLDPESIDDLDAVLAQRATLDSPEGNATLYFPWVEAAPTGISLLLPPSGFVAGAFARFDPPGSPIGTIVTATDVSLRLTTQQSDALTAAGVNPIRYFTGPDVRIWGARTMSSDPEWRYVPVRRVALFLEESIYEGTEWAVFEENDETLWNTLRMCVGDFLFTYFQAGWFQGTTPSQAYFVRCDQTTMTQQDIDEGRTIIQVGFAAIRPAEFVVLTIVQQRDVSSAVPAGPPAQSGGAFGTSVLVWPNPSRDHATIRFDLGPSEPATVSIFDSAGRRIRSLLMDARREATIGEAVWDGRDGSGRPVPGGVYQVRVETGRQITNARVTRIR